MRQKIFRMTTATVLLMAWLSAVISAQPPASSRPPDPASIRQTSSSTYKPPENIEFRNANVMSEGVRIHAELFSLKSLAGKPLPTIIQAHGWGGTAAAFRADSLALANAGYLVIA